MEGFTDIHCHILPGVDDGSPNMERSIAMLQMAYAEEIRNVIMTPHFHGGHMESDAGENHRRFDALKKECTKYENLSEMNLYLGNEIYYFPSMGEAIEEGKILTLAGSDYALVEFGFTSDIRTIKDGVSHVRSEGYIPIIAHIERYEKVVAMPKVVDELISRGAYIQINTEAFEGGFRTKSFIKRLLKNEQVHFVATDAHNNSNRAPKMLNAAEYILKHYGEGYMSYLFYDNPECVIKNEYIPQ